MSNYPQTYFKTSKAFEEAVKEENNAKKQEVECACGRTPGAVVYNDDYSLSHYLVFCEACYDNATIRQRGE